MLLVTKPALRATQLKAHFASAEVVEMDFLGPQQLDVFQHHVHFAYLFLLAVLEGDQVSVADGADAGALLDLLHVHAIVLEGSSGFALIYLLTIVDDAGRNVGCSLLVGYVVI